MSSQQNHWFPNWGSHFSSLPNTNNTLKISHLPTDGYDPPPVVPNRSPDGLVISSSTFNMIVDARKFMNDFRKINTQRVVYEINIDTDWVKSIQNAYDETGKCGLTRNPTAIFDVHTTSRQEENEIKRYAFHLGKQSRFWIQKDQGHGSYKFDENSVMDVPRQLASNLNTYILNTFLFRTQYQVNSEILKKKLVDVKTNFSDIETFLNDEEITSVGDIINTNNTAEILNSFIEFGLFDHHQFHSEYIFEGDILRFKAKMCLTDSPHHWLNEHPEKEIQIEHILHVNLVQRYPSRCKRNNTYRKWINSIREQTEKLNKALSDIKERMHCISIQNARQIHTLEGKINEMKSSLQISVETIEFMKQKHNKELSSLQTQLDTYSASQTQLVELQSSIEERILYAVSVKKMVADKGRVGYSLEYILKTSSLPTYIVNTILQENKNLPEAEQTTKVLETINAYSDSINSQHNDIGIQLQQCKTTIHTIESEIENIIEKRNNIEIQKNLLQQQKKSILLQKINIEQTISSQNEHLQNMTESLKQDQSTLDQFEESFKNNSEKQKAQHQTYEELCSRVKSMYRKKNISEKMHSDTLQQLEVLSHNLLRTNEKYNTLKVKYSHLIGKNNAYEKKLLSELQILNSSENKHDLQILEMNEIKNKCINLSIQTQENRKKVVMMDIISRYHTIEYNQISQNTTTQLEFINIFDKKMQESIFDLQRELQLLGKNNNSLRDTNHSLYSKVEVLRRDILKSRHEVTDLKDEKIHLLRTIDEMESLFSSSKDTEQNSVLFLKNQIRLLEVHNSTLEKQQNQYVKRVEQMSETIQGVQDISFITIDTLNTIETNETNETNGQKNRNVQLSEKYLNNLQALSSILPLLRHNYGIKKSLYDIYKLTEVLKLCKTLHDTKRKIDSINRKKIIGIGGDGITKIKASLNLLDYAKYSTIAQIAYKKIRHVLKNIFIPRFRWKKYKKDKINFFQDPTEFEIMIFNFKMAIGRQMKQRSSMKKSEIDEKQRQEDDKDAVSEGFASGSWEWEYYIIEEDGSESLVNANGVKL